MGPSSFGPLYCETGHAWLFMAEPVNTLSNLVIIVAALLGFFAIRKMGEKHPYDLYLLDFFLFAVGVGSFWWHAFRTQIGLTFDFVPGILFLLFFTYLWMRKVYGVIAGMAGVLTLIGAVAIVGRLTQGSSLPFLFPIFGSVLAVGGLFIYFTYRRFGTWFAGQGLLILMVALAAAFFRTIDLSTCAVLPFGTHFLWHILLSTAAYLAIVFLLKLDARRP